MKVLIGPNVMGLEKGIPELKQAHPTIEFVHCADREALAAAIADADIYMGHLSREVFLAAKKLQWVQSPSSGVNYFLAIPELKDGPVILTGARGTHAASVAESAMAMILAITRGIVDSVQAQPQHKWVGSVRQKLLELTDLKMGIIGLGSIGKALAKRAYAFDMHVDRRGHVPEQQAGLCPRAVGAGSPERPAGRVGHRRRHRAVDAGCPGHDRRRADRPDEADARCWSASRAAASSIRRRWPQALREKRIASAALDVFEPEPLPADSELWDIENLLIAPHIAGGTQYEGKYLLEIFGENLAKFVAGEFPLRNQINKQIGILIPRWPASF